MFFTLLRAVSNHFKLLFFLYSLLCIALYGGSNAALNTVVIDVEILQ